MSTYETWKAGISLSESYSYFAPAKLRAEYDAPKAPPSKLSRGMAMMVEQFPDKKEQLLAAAQKAQAELNRLNVRSTAIYKMRDFLLRDLRKQNLFAYGFVLPRKRSDIPRLIPGDLFRPEFVNWRNSSLRGAGLEFVSVTVVSAKTVGKIVAQLAKNSPAKQILQKRGPMPSAGAIKAAVQSLIKQGQLPNGNLQKQNVGLVRSRIHELFPGEFAKDRGLSGELIRKILAQLIPRVLN